MFILPVQLTTSKIGNLTRLIHNLLYVMTIHTYIHTYIRYILRCYYYANNNHAGSYTLLYNTLCVILFVVAASLLLYRTAVPCTFFVPFKNIYPRLL